MCKAELPFFKLGPVDGFHLVLKIVMGAETVRRHDLCNVSVHTRALMSLVYLLTPKDVVTDELPTMSVDLLGWKIETCPSQVFNSSRDESCEIPTSGNKEISNKEIRK